MMDSHLVFASCSRGSSFSHVCFFAWRSAMFRGISFPTLSIYTLFIRKLLRKIFPTSVPLAALICIGSLNRQSWRWWHQLSWLSFRLVMALVILKCSPICSPVHCVSAFSILYIIFLKNLLKALFQQHQHFVKMYIPFTTVHLFPGFQV